MAAVEVENECRICRGEDEPERPLLHPCRCSGSIKYTHEDCLVNWLAQSGSSRCELCNHPFRFEPLYEPNTPSALPTHEFLVGILALTNKTMRTAARIVLVFTVWLFFLPVGTCWTWYALFISSPSQLPALLASRGPAGVVTDAFYGCLLSAGIVFVFLGVSSLREYIRHFPQDVVDPGEEQGFDVFDEGDALPPDVFDEYSSDEDVARPPLGEQGNGAPHEMVMDAMHAATMAAYEQNQAVFQPPDERAADLHFGDPNAQTPVVPDDMPDEVFAQVDELVRDTYDVIAGGDDSDENLEEEEDLLAGDSDDEREQLFDGRQGNHEQDVLIEYAGPESEDEFNTNGSDFADEDGIAGQPLLVREDVLRAHDHPDGHHHEAFEEGEEDENDAGADGGALFGLFELDPDEVPLEEVVGLRGQIRNLFDNAGTVLVSNAIFLGVFTLIPLLIGRLTLRLFSLRTLKLKFPSGKSSLQSFFSSLFPSLAEDLFLDISTVASNLATTELGNGSETATAVGSNMKNTLKYVNANVSGALQTQDVLVSVASEAESVVATAYDEPLVSYVDNFLIVMLGYGMIALIAVGYIGVISMLRQRYPRFDSPITRQIARLLRYVATFVKIVVLILFEFGIFPLGCGWWLDVCTLELLGGSLQSRLSYCHDSPWTCTGGHWMMGIIYMVHISLFISLLREVVKPQLLWFLRNPDDPEFHPFRELVEKPLSRHARRMCISVIIYVPLILALVYVPGQLCLRLLPNVFPFRSEDFSHILIDVPFGNLLIGPLIRLLYFGRPGISLHKIVATWIRWVSTGLRIEHLVVKDEDQDGDAHRREHNNVGMAGPIVEGLEPRDGGPLHRMFGDHGHNILVDGHPGTNIANLAASDEEFILSHDDDSGLSQQEIRLRAVIMIFSAWITLILAESALIAVPTILGRSLMSALGLPVRHDLHPFLLGLNVLFGSVSGAVKLVKYIETVDTFTALSLGLPYLYLAGKGLLVVYIWLGVIPLASGLLFELILMPIRVSYNETPYFCLHQDWALGLLLLKVWTCIAVTGGLGSKWRERVLRAREGDVIGFNQNFARTMREVVLPVLFSVVTALSVPYSVARGLLPALGAARWVSNLVYRYAYLVIACLYCGFETLRYSVSILRDLHDSIRDDKYLVGKRLYNFMDSPEATVIDNQ